MSNGKIKIFNYRCKKQHNIILNTWLRYCLSINGKRINGKATIADSRDSFIISTTGELKTTIKAKVDQCNKRKFSIMPIIGTDIFSLREYIINK